jgi:hypothetical protein
MMGMMKSWLWRRMWIAGSWDGNEDTSVAVESWGLGFKLHLSSRVYNQRAIVDNARRTGEGENLLHRVLHNYTAGRNCCVRSGGGARLGLVI